MQNAKCKMQNYRGSSASEYYDCNAVPKFLTPNLESGMRNEEFRGYAVIIMLRIILN